MRSEHGRYEKLAVGHVLGGLDADESADFRNHLLGCRDCRLRVAELRDLAADLAAADRDERARAQVRTEVVRRDDQDDEDAPSGHRSRIGPRQVTIAALLVIVFAGAMAFWNLHLRTAAAAYSQAADYRGETLRGLATGVPVSVEAGPGVDALVVVGDGQVAFSISGLPALAEGERLEVWLLDGDEASRAVEPVAARHVAAGEIAGHAELAGGAVLVITRERGPRRDDPGGSEVVRAALDTPA